MKAYRIITFLAVTALLGGCASSNSGEVYSRDQARRTQTVQMGTVQFVKNIQIEGTKSGVGVVGGGVAGGVIGSTIGSGKGSILAAVGGAALGAVGGAVAEEKLTKKNGLEITVKLDSGSIIAVVQEADVMYSVGERVRVLTGSDGTTRVAR
ncbi:MAG: glycine zipper 2TM domain-containing protein [Kiritimatiellales bacterium]